MSQASFDPQAFRAALGTFTTGVTIITTRGDDDTPIGVTANSFNSVSLNPPLVLWSLAKSANSLPAFETGRHWNVHVLSADQQALAASFAAQGADKFGGLELEPGISPAPLLPHCTARFQCRTAFRYDGGDHVIFVGEVLAYERDAERRPLLLWQRGHRAHQLDDFALGPEQTRFDRGEGRGQAAAAGAEPAAAAPGAAR